MNERRIQKEAEMTLKGRINVLSKDKGGERTKVEGWAIMSIPGLGSC